MAKIFLGVPSYKKEMHSDLFFKAPNLSKDHSIALGNIDSSAICMTMNLLWLQAIEAYDSGQITHFSMLHTDIIPEDFYLDKLVAIMEREQADIVSAIVPIKNNQGRTSTAIDEPMGDADPYFRVRHLTMRDLDKRPPTFTDPKLLLNTGVMLVDLSKPWVKDDNVYFTIEDGIRWYRGKRVAYMWPEDWGFSRRARQAGAKKLCATREVKLVHVGLADFPNDVIWGSMDTDSLPAPAPEFRVAADAAAKVPGYMAWEELAWLAEAAKGKEVVEIGSWLGRSTKAMAATASKVWAVDHWKGTQGGDATGEQAKTINPYAEFCHNLGPEINSQKVTAVTADHTAETFGQAEMFAELGGQEWSPGMIFIDGDHAYEAVKRDIQNAKAMLKAGGMLSGHDFNEAAHPGVVQAVKELVPGYAVAPGTTIWYAVVGKPENAPPSPALPVSTHS